MTDELQRVPPQNLEAESSVLGAILLENEAISRALEIVKPDDFYRQSHQKIFRAMIKLADSREPIDLITLSEFLNGRGDLEPVGGSAYLAALNDFTPTAVNIAYYARIVKDKADARRLINTLREATNDLFSGDGDIFTIAGKIGSHLSHLSDGKGNNFVPIGSAVTETLKQIEQAYERGSLVTGIPTGLKLLDESTGGIQPGELFIVAGRPGMGKTGFAGGIATAAAAKGYGVLFVTAESRNTEIVTRMIAAATRIENRNLRRGKLNDRDFPIITAEAAWLEKLPIDLLHGEKSWDRIKAKIRTAKLKNPNTSLVIVDYVGLLSAPSGNRSERYLEIGRISSEAKTLAIELNIGFVLLSQLNREVESRPGCRPKISDLRESGNLEQDADVIGLFYRESYYNDKAPKDYAELDVAKVRNGKTGIIPLKFDECTTSFTDWIEPAYDEAAA
jgi:replicative DNA helicase